MKLPITLCAIAVALAVFAFTTCETTEIPQDIDLELLSVKIGDLNVALIPIPVPGENWDDEEYEVATADSGTVIVKDTYSENKRITATASKGTVKWGVGGIDSRPGRFRDLREPAEFGLDDFVYLQLSDGESSLYYRFYPYYPSPVRELASITIAGRDPNEITLDNEEDPSKPIKARVARPTASLQTLSGLIAGSQNYRGQIDITRGEATAGSRVAAAPQDGRSKIRYAIAVNPAAAGRGEYTEFVDAEKAIDLDEQSKEITVGESTLTFADNNVLVVEVTAQNEEDQYFYGFVVTAGRMAVIANLTLDGEIVVGKGVQDNAWATVAPGGFATADQGDNGLTIGIQLEDPDGTYEYALITNTANADGQTYGTASAIKFNNGQSLAIRVRSARNNPNDLRYYKIAITLLAANIIQQPKSAAYSVESHEYVTAEAPGEEHHGRLLVDDPANAGKSITLSPATIEPLSVVLDRDLTGATYTWYTANSWYGGYGFDREGRIGGDPGDIVDDYHPNADGRDEKGNISLHNGGNQFYRLPYPGYEIEGAGGTVSAGQISGDKTTITYTPTISAKNRPFITGFTNQTQYYYVVVEKGGQKATSKRAAIVTEWNQAFGDGIPGAKLTGDAKKKHYIVDLYAAMDTPARTAEGLQDNPQNVAPFKAGNHGDQYYIPMKFPDGFNVKDYSIVTCQAIFYLADGKVWIQNWTQGDFGFADAAKEKLVLWYNVTNDNATRGLSGSGNDPSGSGLDETPAYLLIQPAGTKPLKQLPPFKATTDAWGRPEPQANNDAQGWFTPYIEIVELRFEGPARK